ncbi:MAG: hypothetical protein AB1405_15130 [Bdellovibrionota bacterium]
MQARRPGGGRSGAFSVVLSIPAFLLAYVGLLLWLHQEFFDRIRARHPAAWRELGAPSILTNNSLSPGSKVSRWLGRREYLKLGDKGLTRRAWTLRLLGNLYKAAFAALFLWWVWTAFGPGRTG